MAKWIDKIRSLWVWGQWQTETPSCRLLALPAQSAASLPRNLKRLREQRGLTVGALAIRTQCKFYGPVSASTIRAIERTGGAGPNPCLTTLLALALALEVGVEALVEEGR